MSNKKNIFPEVGDLLETNFENMDKSVGIVFRTEQYFIYTYYFNGYHKNRVCVDAARSIAKHLSNNNMRIIKNNEK